MEMDALVLSALMVCKATKKNLETEVSSFIAQAYQHREIIDRVEADVRKYDDQARGAQQSYYATLEEVKYNDVKITEMQRKIVESQTKLKQQQNLYEQVRSERNSYQKNLLEAQKEISEMKRTFRSMNHDINQMKEEITQKDHSLVKEHFDHHKVEKQKVKIRNELTKVRKQIESCEQITSSQTVEVQKLGRIIYDADEERKRQKKELAAVVGERDILTAQLVRRNAELADLYEKIKLNRSSLKQGEEAYNNVLSERKKLRKEIHKLLETLEEAKNQHNDVPAMKAELYSLERELMNEKAKVKALRNEEMRPLNVHRWRKLHDADPKRYASLQKVQHLQKQLIEKTERVTERDLLIQEKERLYVELKNILARQPGPEVAEQLAVYGGNLKDKKKQMKAMEAELSMYKAQVDEYKFELEQIDKAFESFKQEYFSMMRRVRDGHLPPDTPALSGAGSITPAEGMVDSGSARGMEEGLPVSR
eukprot:g4411.t1